MRAPGAVGPTGVGLNFARSNITCPERIMFIVKHCWGLPFPVGCALASLGESLAHVQNWGASKLTCPTLLLVDQQFIERFSPNAGGIVVDTLVFLFWIPRSFPDHSRSKSKVVQNRPEFCTFLVADFSGKAPKFWELN